MLAILEVVAVARKQSSHFVRQQRFASASVVRCKTVRNGIFETKDAEMQNVARVSIYCCKHIPAHAAATTASGFLAFCSLKSII